MDLEKDKLALIEKIIKNDKKFSNNEDLYDDFFNETCKRSLGIINIITSDDVLKPYLRKIATTAIINVLKDNGRLRRTSVGYVTNEEVLSDKISYENIEISYNNFTIAETPEDIVIKKDTLAKIANMIHEIDLQEEDKHYLDIYKLRYENGLTQKEIAEELNLSQSEISKRIFKLMKRIKQSFN